MYTAVKYRRGNMTTEKTRIESGKNLNTRKLMKQFRRKAKEASQQPVIRNINFQYKLKYSHSSDWHFKGQSWNSHSLHHVR